LTVQHSLTYESLEIKPCGLGSRIQDMEAKSHNGSHFLNLWKAKLALWDEPKCASRYDVFWPLTAFTTLEVKNYHVITQGICNKFIEVNFCVGFLVSLPNCLFQLSTTMSLINNISE
jgi:hypothetical protein